MGSSAGHPASPPSESNAAVKPALNKACFHRFISWRSRERSSSGSFSVAVPGAPALHQFYCIEEADGRGTKVAVLSPVKKEENGSR